ncbi:MAG: transcriptional repressor [Planctomycetota bacterium]
MPARRHTAQQRAIREALEHAGRPLSMAEIHQRAAQAVPTLSLRTAYRVVHRLLDDQDAVAVPVLGQPDRYEPAAVADRHHHHFRCEACDRVFDIAGCPGGLKRMLPEGFELAGHELTLWGRCAECA